MLILEQVESWTNFLSIVELLNSQGLGKNITDAVCPD